MIEPCGCKIIFYGLMSDMGGEIKYCPLHAAAENMKTELERLRDLVGEADYELVDAVIALTEKRS